MSDAPNPGANSDPERTPQGLFAEGMADAARRAGFAKAAGDEPIRGRALLEAMGGLRGIIEAVLPGLVFLVTYTLTYNLVLSLIAPVVIGVAFAVIRLAQRQPVTQALGGLFGIVISAVLALMSGRAEDFYLPGFWINSAYAAALLISVFAGWPLIGLAVGFLMGDGLSWRQDPSKRKVLTILTLCWAGLFLLRLAVQVPLYLAGNVEWLGATRLLMGIPLFAPLLVISWLMVRSVYRAAGERELG